MGDREEWGPWIEHDGKGLPVPAGTIVNVILRDGESRVAVAGLFPKGPPKTAGSSWHWGTGRREVIRYRICKPRGMTILQDLIADLPAPVSPKVDA